MGKPHPSVGINAKRGCTDCVFLILYFLVWGGMIYLAQLAILNGDPERLVYGTDYLGNICGQKNVTPVETQNWANRKILWYPITYDFKSQKLLVKEAIKLGICVEKCPKAGDIVEGYGALSANQTSSSSTGNGGAGGAAASFFGFNSASPKWPVLFDSNETFHRCLPDFINFDCPNVSSCKDQLLSAAEQFGNAAQINDVIEQGIAEVVSNYWVIVAGLGITIVISFIWLFLVRCIVKPIVVVTMILVLLLLGGAGAGCFYLRKLKLEATPSQPETAEYYLYAAIGFWILTFLYLCVLIFMWKDIMTACDIIEEASKVPTSIPTMVMLPPLLLILIVPTIIFHGVVAAYVESSGDNVIVEIPTPTFWNSSSGEISPSFNFTAAVFNNTYRSNLTVTQEYQVRNWRTYAHLYNLFVFLWGFGFINAIGFLSLAFCGVFWYFSNPGDRKDPPNGSVLIGLKNCFRYHIGTLAFGSLIVALIQLLRVIMLMVEHRLKQLGERTEAVAILFKCIHCCLACLERVVKFINKNAYIICAITGENFLSSARTALDLLLANALSVGAVTVIGEYVMIFGKVVITMATVGVCYVLMDQTKSNTGISNGWLVLSIVAVIAYFIATLFIAVFSVCIDTILLCFCYDKKHRDIDYFPKDLANHVAKAEARAEKIKQMRKEAAGIKDDDHELSQRLTPGPGARAGAGKSVSDDML